MKFNLQGDNDYIFDLKTAIFKNRGVTEKDIGKFINPSELEVNHYLLLKNIKKAVFNLLGHIDKGSKIHIIVDSDMDGYTSASYLYLYLKEIYPKWKSHITWNVHKSKEHGIVLEELEEFKNHEGEYQFDLLIVPDGLSTDYDKYDYFKELGIDVILLDHHNFEDESQNAIVVNPHASPNYPTTEICGAMVVHKFCQALDEKLSVDFSDRYIDLVATGTIADVMDSKVLENRYIINKGLKNIEHPFIKALIEKQSFSMKRTNMTGIAWFISPLINAVTRIGTYEERMDLFRAMVDFEATTLYKPRGKKEEEIVLLYKDMARQVKNIKARQDRLRNKITNDMIELSTSDNVINLVPIVDDEDYKNLKGVLAIKIANSIGKPTLVYVEREHNGKEVLTGSGRNADNHVIKDFRAELLASGLMEKVGGHDNAFGFEIKKDNVEKLHEYLNNKFADAQPIITIDFKMKSSQLTQQIVKTFDNLQDIWGSKFKEPKVYIENINLDDVYVNDKKSLLSFKGDNEIEYKMFYPNDKTIAELQETEDGVVDIIGTLGINEWNKNTTYQVMIENYEIKENVKKEKKEINKKDFFF